MPIDDAPEDHEQAMGGFQVDDAYESRPAFFRRYLFGYHAGRLEWYDQFLRAHLSKEAAVLSIASGRCANELFLMEDGYRMTCSDLKEWEAYTQTKVLFPQFEFIQLNILASPSPRRYDAIICLGLLYLFDATQLQVFFRHVDESLQPGGHLLLDAAGTPDTLLAYLLHEVWLQYETLGVRTLKGVLQGRLDGMVTKHHGWRRTDHEIIHGARQAGFILRHYARYGPTAEFQRSRVLQKLIAAHPVCERAFSALGRAVPLVRMYDFEKPSAGHEAPPSMHGILSGAGRQACGRCAEVG